MLKLVGLHLEQIWDRGGAQRPNLPSENKLARAIDQVLERAAEVLDAHGDCDCDLCVEIGHFSYMVSMAGDAVRGMLLTPRSGRRKGGA